MSRCARTVSRTPISISARAPLVVRLPALQLARSRVVASAAHHSHFKLIGGTTRACYVPEDAEEYFQYMGILAEECTFDRLNGMVKQGMDPIDIILVLACGENDVSKVSGPGGPCVRPPPLPPPLLHMYSAHVLSSGCIACILTLSDCVQRWLLVG